MLRQQYKRLVPGGASVSRRGLGLTCRGLSQVTQAKKNGERRASGGGGGGGDPLRERIYLERRENGVLKPEPLPVTHSAAFLQRSRGVWENSEVSTSKSSEERSERPSSGVELFVSSVDKKLDDLEDSPPELVEAFSEAISSDTGKTVRKGMVQAAKLTVDAGVVVAKGAAKGAVPVVSWALKEGTKAIISGGKNPKKKKT